MGKGQEQMYLQRKRTNGQQAHQKTCTVTHREGTEATTVSAGSRPAGRLLPNNPKDRSRELVAMRRNAPVCTLGGSAKQHGSSSKNCKQS